MKRILKVKNLINSDKIKLMCTDKDVLYDVTAWCRVHGHVVEGIEQLGSEIKIIVQVK